MNELPMNIERKWKQIAHGCRTFIRLKNESVPGRTLSTTRQGGRLGTIAHRIEQGLSSISLVYCCCSSWDDFQR